MTIDEILAVSILILIFVGVIIIMIYISSNEKKEFKEQYRRYNEKYRYSIKTFSRPKDYYYVSVIGQSDDRMNHFEFYNHMVWRDGNVLCFFPEKINKEIYENSEFFELDDLRMELNKIDVDSIYSFRIELDHIEKNAQEPDEYVFEAGIIRGFSSSKAGNFVGREFHQQIVKYEAQECTLFYTDHENQKQRLVLEGDDAEVLNILLPEKEYEFYEKYSMDEFENEGVDEYNLPKLIREYGKLRDEGLISAEEFEQKKQQLLGLDEVSDVNEE